MDRGGCECCSLLRSIAEPLNVQNVQLWNAQSEADDSGVQAAVNGDGDAFVRLFHKQPSTLVFAHAGQILWLATLRAYGGVKPADVRDSGLVQHHFFP